jgi:hypothetical protein
VYREALTVATSGSAGNPIVYVGDYTGANTDGVGGVVRITGSDNDQTATRSDCITGARNYRTFRGFLLDMTSSHSVLVGGTHNTFEQMAVVNASGIAAGCFVNNGAAQSNMTVRNCWMMVSRPGYGIWFTNGSTLDDCGHVVENCVMIGGFNSHGVRTNRVGGITVRNCTMYGMEYGVIVATALTAGQTVTVNNCIFQAIRFGLHATAAGEITENYNSLWDIGAPRTNTNTGANSNAFPPLFDTRWFFEAVNGGKLVTPFDLASYSQLVNVAGTSPTTADLRGTTVIGAQREWGPLEYDPALLIEAGSGGGGGGRRRRLWMFGG